MHLNPRVALSLTMNKFEIRLTMVRPQRRKQSQGVHQWQLGDQILHVSWHELEPLHLLDRSVRPANHTQPAQPIPDRTAF